MDAALAWAIAALVLVIAEQRGNDALRGKGLLEIGRRSGAEGGDREHQEIERAAPSAERAGRRARLARRTQVQAERHGERDANPEMRLRSEAPQPLAARVVERITARDEP
jgi:hypothetical protein